MRLRSSVRHCCLGKARHCRALFVTKRVVLTVPRINKLLSLFCQNIVHPVDSPFHDLIDQLPDQFQFFLSQFESMLIVALLGECHSKWQVVLRDVTTSAGFGLHPIVFDAGIAANELEPAFRCFLELSLDLPCGLYKDSFPQLETLYKRMIQLSSFPSISDA